MWPFPNPLDLFGDAVGAVTGWAWDKVIQGVYTWFANGLLLLMEWVWGVLDTATTPRLTEAWFATGLVRPLASLSAAITVAMMLGSAVQAGFAGRPELIIDAIKEGSKSILASAVTLTVMDVLIRAADVIGDVAWHSGRADAVKVLDGLATVMGTSSTLGATFIGPLALLFGMVGLQVTTVVLFMRSSLLYLVAAFSPIVWSSSVSPAMRGSARRLVHVVVALVLAKPAITLTLVVGVKLLANSTTPGAAGSDGVAALGTLVSGFSCFAIAGLSPWVVYRLLPSVEQASVSSGIVGGWSRAGMTAVHAGLMVKSLGASGGASAATRALPSAGSFGGSGGGGASSGSSFGGGGSPTPGTGSGSGGARLPTVPPVARRSHTAAESADDSATAGSASSSAGDASGGGGRPSPSRSGGTAAGGQGGTPRSEPARSVGVAGGRERVVPPPARSPSPDPVSEPEGSAS